MILIFDLAILSFLLYMGYRLSFAVKERAKIKKELKLELNPESTERLNFLNVFLFFMFLLIGILSFTYIKFVLNHIKEYLG